MVYWDVDETGNSNVTYSLGLLIVSSAAVIRVVTQRFSPTSPPIFA